MKMGSIARFSSHPRPFVIENDYCPKVDCSCHAVNLTFTELSYPGEGDRKPLSFSTWIDLDTWQELDPPKRSQRTDAWVREFLEQCPEDRKTEYRSGFERDQARSRRMAEYTVDPHDALSRELLSFSDVLTERGSLSSGGDGFMHRFLHAGREYHIEDLYCLNPGCDCQSVHVTFWECVTRYRDGQDVFHIIQRFTGKVSFTGETTISQQGDCTLDEAHATLSSWWHDHEEDLEMLRKRYDCVKDIGRRSTEDYVPPPKPSSARHPVIDDVPTQPFSEPKRVGRNDPCPCGSGRKFKRCCARQSRGDRILTV